MSEIFKKTINNLTLSQSQQETKATDTSEKETRISICLPYIKSTSENCGVYSDLIRKDPLPTLKTFSIIFFCKPVAREVENNIIYKLAVVTVSVYSVSLSGL